jgi:hypothetical protein
LAEARFLARAMDLGLTVSKPFGDSARYDFIVDAGRGRLSRIQVKSAWTPRRQRPSYQMSVGPRQDRGQRFRPYRRDEIDYLAAYIAPEDAWFIIPVDRVPHRKNVIFSTSPGHRLAPYRNAWHLLGVAHAPSSVQSARDASS